MKNKDRFILIAFLVVFFTYNAIEPVFNIAVLGVIAFHKDCLI